MAFGMDEFGLVSPENLNRQILTAYELVASGSLQHVRALPDHGVGDQVMTMR